MDTSIDSKPLACGCRACNPNLKTNVALTIDIRELEALMNELVSHQERKVLQLARSRLPHLTGDDILNSHDFPQLAQDPIYNYEEGIAAGLLSAQIAIRARARQLGGS